jgi:HSP20 family protein
MFSLIRRRPARTERGLTRRLNDPFFALREEMDNLLEQFMDGWRLPEEWVEPREWHVDETEKEIVMRVELPGFDAKEIEVRREANVLVVRAEHRAATEEKENEPHRAVERFEHRMTLPYGTDAEHVEAIYRNGVLELHFPRLPEAQPRRIEVRT